MEPLNVKKLSSVIQHLKRNDWNNNENSILYKYFIHLQSLKKVTSIKSSIYKPIDYLKSLDDVKNSPIFDDDNIEYVFSENNILGTIIEKFTNESQILRDYDRDQKIMLFFLNYIIMLILKK
jgi:hypothetical protein